jgi:hypothetical protein
MDDNKQIHGRRKSDAPPAKKNTPTESKEEQRRQGEPRRSLSNHPVDANSLAAKADNFHGIDPETAHDPGRQTPGAPKADNRS